MPMTPEYTEVVAGSPERLFGVVKDLTDWIPKLVPHIFPHAEPHEGEDDAGPAFHYHIHEDFHHVEHGTNQKIRIVLEDYNPEARSCIVEYQGVYPEYRQFKYHTKFEPGPSPNTTALKWSIEYYPWDEETGAPDHIVAFNVPRHLYSQVHFIYEFLTAAVMDRKVHELGKAVSCSKTVRFSNRKLLWVPSEE